MKKMVQFFKSKKLYRYSFIVAAVLVSAAVVYAATVPYTFTSGTVAKSSEVNANFTYLADRSWEKSGSDLYYSSGNVGIGTTSPGQKLDVWGNLRVNGTNEHPGYYLDIAYGGIRSGMTTWDLYVADAGATSSTVMTLTNTGHVGIGTTSPTQKLYVAGNIYATGSITQGSSRALKENIKNLEAEKAISALNELSPVVYNYKADKSQGHVGFIAEDVPAILATKDRKGVSPMDVVALLTKVVQEQQKTISVLAKEVEGLKKGRM